MTAARICTRCRAKPVATARHAHCYDCLPDGPRIAPPCRKCGSDRDYYSAGLCRRCHRFAPHVIDSCVGCLGWGTTRHTSWLCEACRSWRRRVSKGEGACVTCRDWSELNGEGLCRLCRRQTALVRTLHRGVTATEANRHGQQLFIVDTFHQQRPRPSTGTLRIGLPPGYPVPHRQLTLFDAARDLTRLRNGGHLQVPEPRDPVLAAALLLAADEHATRYGWSRTRKVDARSAIRILLALQDTPGAAITASAVLELVQRFAAQPVLDILAETGMLNDDREPSVTGWFHNKISGLPEPMAGELRTWFQVMRDGSASPPRRLPRSHTTIRLHLRFALPTLTSWATAGHTSLREISRSDVLAALPHQGPARATVGQGLRSIFTVLKGRKVIFANPMTRVRTGRAEANDPLPLAELAGLHQALDSDDSARAAMTALAAFHGLRNHNLRELLLTDLDGVRLRIGDRSILLAALARRRLTAWLDHRAARWPTTLNPHLFINVYTAVRTGQVSTVYVNEKVGMRVQRIREDRILHEAHATGGDTRRLCDLFGLSIGGAERYTATINHPDLDCTDELE
ncbi:hypothetical protein ACGFIV_32365 [Sphaerisporangium sp. NPDC049003]|uniref:hypothetical protein n=1 Tax=Sphaerisporangium sp. NPDC049003 TaxID=3364517 RepID=UPI0037139BF8